jgi:hypothetical protein
MLKYFLLFFTIIFSSFSFAYSQELKGRVLNEKGVPAIYITVSFKSKGTKVLTDADGRFKIIAAKLPDSLEFSAAGFETYKVLITEKNVKDPNFEVVLLNKRRKQNAAPVSADIPNKSSPVKVLNRDGRDPSKTIAYDSITYGLSPRFPKSIPEDEFMLNGKKFYISDTELPSRDGVLLKSRILTAGEVNDFNKWKMWEDLTENEFKMYGNKWGIEPRQRYSVQIKNKNNDVVESMPVYLVNTTNNDTVWRAYTDNTGKAELWANIFDSTESTARYAIVGNNKILLNSAVGFANGINTVQVEQPCNVLNKVDIAFMVDATGSMGDEIEFLKLELEDVLSNTFTRYNNLELRAAAVFFRDRGDEYITRHIDFQTDLLKLLNFTKLQVAAGGGDEPEAVDSALSVALNRLSWNRDARTRLLFFVTDAPPHDYAKASVRQLIEKAAAMGVRIIPLACSGTSKSYEFLLRSMALATNGTYAFLTDHSGIGNSHIEPTTDKYRVELLNSLLQRIIDQSIYVNECKIANNIVLNEPITHQPQNIANIKIFPNPTQGLLNVEYKKEIKELFVADFTGKLLKRIDRENKKQSQQVDFSMYPSGVYFLKYITADNKWGAAKVVLQH